MVVMNAISREEVLSQVELSEAPIWIQILNIPLNFRTNTNVVNIANNAGRFLWFDEKGKQARVSPIFVIYVECLGIFLRSMIDGVKNRMIRKELPMGSGFGLLLANPKSYKPPKDQVIPEGLLSFIVGDSRPAANQGKKTKLGKVKPHGSCATGLRGVNREHKNPTTVSQEDKESYTPREGINIISHKVSRDMGELVAANKE
ncbi:hypothetical protein Tsubulata_002495 [Turnera subulata]|uniref:DUF4283 domain-containing protein n=1 Tax=Turnera subulata TaxID=218843 RepID=A0A9Q0JR45_9ROSI|nr:hypothetical protein Tsubulata_002495 [Turnera subulata]